MSLKKIIKEQKAKKVKGGVFIPLQEGDVILRGKFRNKKVVVKDISISEHGLPLVNGKNITNIRLTQNNDDE